MGKDVPILHGILVITTVAVLQTVAEWTINRNKRLEIFMEGRADCLVEDGLIVTSSLDRNNLSHEDLFRFLRSKDVEQLGQVKRAFFETSGLVSVWCFPKTEIVPGLGIQPMDYRPDGHPVTCGDRIEKTGYYSCRYCGFTLLMKQGARFTPCEKCNENDWSSSVRPEVDLV